MKKEPLSDDGRKFTRLAAALACLVILILVSNVLRNTFFSDAGAYLKRRYYYEHSISNKGLELHRGMYWKEKE